MLIIVQKKIYFQYIKTFSWLHAIFLQGAMSCLLYLACTHLNHFNFQHILVNLQPMGVNALMWQFVHILKFIEGQAIGGGFFNNYLIVLPISSIDSLTLSKKVFSVSSSLNAFSLLDWILEVLVFSS